MANLLPLEPGCLVVWQRSDDKFDFALVIQFVEHDPGRGDTDNTWYDVTIVKNERVKTMMLWKTDNGTKWRVLHRAA